MAALRPHQPQLGSFPSLALKRDYKTTYAPHEVATERPLINRIVVVSTRKTRTETRYVGDDCEVADMVAIMATAWRNPLAGRIMATLAEHGRPLSPLEIAVASGIQYQSIHRMRERLMNAGLIVRIDEGYSFITYSVNPKGKRERAWLLRRAAGVPLAREKGQPPTIAALRAAVPGVLTTYGNMKLLAAFREKVKGNEKREPR
jgi:DNA-binding MarR family transcriptional regulator